MDSKGEGIPTTVRNYGTNPMNGGGNLVAIEVYSVWGCILYCMHYMGKSGLQKKSKSSEKIIFYSQLGYDGASTGLCRPETPSSR